MSRALVSNRRRTLAIGFALAVVPLVALLGLQWVWLGRLEETTRIARQAALRNLADVITAEVESFYRTTAERALGAAAGATDLPAELARGWARQPLEGVRTLFVVDYVGEPFGRVLEWDAEARGLVSPPASDEALAIIVACTPWQMASYHRRAAESASPLVDERDPAHRIILRPFVDEDSHVLAVAGLVLDEEFLAQRLIPRILGRTDQEDFAVSLRNSQERAAASRGEEPGPPALERPLSWVFTDWSIRVVGPPVGPERWARASFAFNMTLAVLLAFVLLGGMALALRAADRAVQLSDMKSDFVSNVSHELRSPLASIRALAELLKLGRAAPGKVQEYGAHIEAESRRLSRLIDNLLDFSRIESGRKTYHPEESRLEDIVGAAIEAFEVTAQEAGFHLEYRPPPEPLPPVRVDADAITQAIHNLLDNALKYSGDSRRIEVSLDREDGWAVCTVRDWGIGIPRAEQTRIFDRFHRVGSALVHDVKGTGLGLSIVRHVVQAHHGEARLESEPGKGTVVRLCLPLEAGEAGEERPGKGGER